MEVSYLTRPSFTTLALLMRCGVTFDPNGDLTGPEYAVESKDMPMFDPPAVVYSSVTSKVQVAHFSPRFAQWDLRDFLYPVEKGEIIGKYVGPLLQGSVDGFLHLVAVYHAACNIWPDLQSEEVRAEQEDVVRKLLKLVVEKGDGRVVREEMVIYPPACFETSGEWIAVRAEFAQQRAASCMKDFRAYFMAHSLDVVALRDLSASSSFVTSQILVYRLRQRSVIHSIPFRALIAISDGSTNFSTDFSFLVIDTAPSDVVFGCDWMTYCRDITENHREIRLPAHECCSDDNNSVYGSSVDGHIAIQSGSSESDDCVKAEGRIREILFETAMSPSLFSADGVQLSRIAYDHELHIDSSREEMKANLQRHFFSAFASKQELCNMLLKLAR
ncbi:hypothetical protein F4604DRAFT_1677249 [Suillus subluteus]|nr:hypothetical protein F4604DRAFT_1677249 [Suillus subluteus]